MKKYFLIVLMVVLVSVLVFEMCAKAALAQTKGGVLKISRAAESRSLGFPPTVKNSDLFVLTPCVQCLLKIDKQGLPQAWLAESWEVNTAAKTLVLHLRKGVKFHDGTDFDAEAVKFNLTDPWKTPGAEEGIWIYTNSIDVVDKYTVRINIKRWNYAMLVDLATKYGLMISPTAYRKNGMDWATLHPVGTGPFKFVSWQRDVMIKYERFDEYWEKEKPYLDGMEFHIIVDPVTQLASFKRGAEHVMAEISSKDAKDLADSGKFRVTISPGRYHMISGDGIHPDSPWSNLKVRQAMMHAIDREAIAKAIGLGYWTVTPRNQLAYPRGFGDNPEVKGYPYNPAKAKQLLSEAGYPNGFQTSILSMNQPRYNVDYMTAIQGQLKAVGIDGKMELMDPGREFQVQVGGGWKNGLLWVQTFFRTEVTIYYDIYNPESIFHKDTIRPTDFQQRIFDGIEGTDPKTMQPALWKLQKEAVDELAISNYLFIIPALAAKYPTVHDDLLDEYGVTYWSPEDAWLGK
jgi:peptide/nickel transport system substrate-binding protein